MKAIFFIIFIGKIANEAALETLLSSFFLMVVYGLSVESDKNVTDIHLNELKLLLNSSRGFKTFEQRPDFETKDEFIAQMKIYCR